MGVDGLSTRNLFQLTCIIPQIHLGESECHWCPSSTELLGQAFHLYPCYSFMVFISARWDYCFNFLECPWECFGELLLLHTLVYLLFKAFWSSPSAGSLSKSSALTTGTAPLTMLDVERVPGFWDPVESRLCLWFSLTDTMQLMKRSRHGAAFFFWGFNAFVSLQLTVIVFLNPPFKLECSDVVERVLFQSIVHVGTDFQCHAENYEKKHCPAGFLEIFRMPALGLSACCLTPYGITSWNSVDRNEF